MTRHLLTTLAALALAIAPASADIITWSGTNPVDAGWDNSANWDLGVPTTTSTVSLQNGYGPVIGGTSNITVGNLQMVTFGAGDPLARQLASLTLTESATMSIGAGAIASQATGTATISLSGNSYLGFGSLTNGNTGGTNITYINLSDNAQLNVSGAFSSGYAGTSYLTATGSSSVYAGTLNLGRTANSMGEIHLHGSSTLHTGDMFVGFYRGSGKFTATDNATVTIMGNMSIGPSDGASANGLTATGYVAISDNAQVNVRGVINVGNYRTGELHISDNASVTAGNVLVGTNVGSVAGMTGSGTITLNGNGYAGRGTLTTSSITRGAGAEGIVVFNGGLLRSSANNAAFLGVNNTTQILGIFIDEEGAYIDSNGFDIGIASRVEITGSGAFNKLGAGSLTFFDAIPLYTGSTIVHGGTLILTKADQLATSEAVAVLGNATIKTASIDQTLNALSGDGFVNLDSGALTINSEQDTTFSGEIIAAGGFIKTGDGALTLNGNNTLGTVTLSGGILGIGSASALGSSAVTIEGSGALRGDATVAIANSIQAQGTALKFDAFDGVTLTVNGSVTGGQGITKDGAGTINLATDSSGVTGAVTINEGALLVAGLGAGSTVTVADGAGFGGSGIVNGSVTYSGSGALQIGSSHNDSLVTTPATLTITSGLTLGDTVLKYDTYGGNASDKLVANNITLGGQIDIDFSMIRQGTFTLVQTTAGTLDPALPSTINTYRTGFARSTRENLDYNLSPDNKTLSVTITKTNESLTWNGSDGYTWDYNNTTSWSGDDTRFVDGDRVTFAAAGSGTITVDRNNVTAGDMTVTGDGSYTFTGKGRITTDAASTGGKSASFGADTTGKFTMQGTGTVTFANTSNVFLGGLDVLSGVVIGDADSLGKNTDITTTGNGTVIFHQDNNTSYIGRLHGTGYYAKTGAGALTFTAGDSTATGTFDVREGSLLLTQGARLGDIAIADRAAFGGAGEAADVYAGGGSTVRVGIAIAGVEVGTEVLTLNTLHLGNTARIIGAGSLAANINIASGDTGIVEIAENRELVLAGSLGGGGGFTKQGAGSLILTQNATHAGATTIAAGYLRAAAPGVLSANSPHIIKPGGILWLDGHDQTIRSLINEGTVTIGGPVTAGTRLTLANGYSGVAGSILSMNLRATDGAPTAADQIVIQGGEITGRTLIRMNVTDLRANPDAFEACLNDIPALITYEAGDMPKKVFTITDGISVNRVVIGMHDYRLYYYENEARLVAADSAEVPAVLAINPISIAVNRATLNSIGQRLDRLRDLQTAADNKDRDKGLWLQGYYRRDRFYGKNWANTRGAQTGFDIPTDTTAGGTVTYGVLADYTYSKIEIADVFNRPSVTLNSKSLGAYLALQHENWCVDFVAKYTWDDYTIDVTDTPKFETTGASWGGFARLSYTLALKGGWTLVPQTQLIFQSRGVNDATDAYGRTYTFGQKYARIDESNSLESRISLSARRLITLKSGKVLQPWITFGYYHDFKGDMTVTTLNQNGFPVSTPPYHDDLGGGSFQVNAGFSAQLGKRISAIVEGAIQNGGKIDSYSLNAGLSYRW